jgi:phage gpG-like protein
MGANIEIKDDNSNAILAALGVAKAQALEIIGMKAEKYAKALCPVGTSESTGKKGYRGGTLRNSITHGIENGDTVYIGTNVEYAPYVELGTGPNFTPPPEWEQFDAPQGSGIGHAYVRPRPYLRPAIADHKSEFEDILKQELS